MERRKFRREFKLEAVRLIKDRGVSYVQPGGHRHEFCVGTQNSGSILEVAPQKLRGLHSLPILQKSSAFEPCHSRHMGTTYPGAPPNNGLVK